GPLRGGSAGRFHRFGCRRDRAAVHRRAHQGQVELTGARGMRPGEGTNGDWVVVPGTESEIDAAVRQCRRLVTRRALVAAGGSVVALPGIDWVPDIAVLVKLLPEINHAFGLTPEQVERLAPDRRLVVYKAISAGSGMLV